MNPQQIELYRRVKSFRFDADGTSHSFAQRLAEENGWPAPYTARVIEEYRRFAYLAAAAGHPVSPSDAIDQAWHLHLVYTRSYWDEFCGKVLRTALHHEPSRGGRSERAKLDDWYGRTLESYRRFFGEDPPADIWPSLGSKAMPVPSYRRVDVARNWVLPRKRLGVVAAMLAFAMTLAVVALGCNRRSSAAATPDAASSFPATPSGLNLFDLRGREFLVFYGVAFVIAGAVAWNIRLARRGPAGSPRGLHLDPYQVACLNGGPVHTVNAAITALHQRDVIEVRESDSTVSVLRPGAVLEHPLEQSVYYAAGAGGRKGRRPVRDVRAATRPTVNQIADGLKSAGLLVNDADASAAMLSGTLVALIVPAVGVIKVFVGVSRDKPVTYLVLACIVTAMVALMAFARRPYRTRRGDAVLRILRSGNYRLRANPARGGSDSLVLGVALFGLSFLGETELAFLGKALRPKNDVGFRHNGCGGSGCGTSSSCGGISCGSSGGGSSGCGGGGCGGCGGGGD